MPRLLNSQIVAPYANLISSTQSSGFGISCDFYHVGGNIGLKMYKSRIVRDNNFFMQNLLAHYGLAPRAYKRLNIDKGRYGFTTELCEVASDFSTERRIIQVFGSSIHFGKFSYWDKWHDAVANLENSARNAIGGSFYVRDLHSGNYGINYRTGELNIIDVGHFRVAGVYNARGNEYRVERCPTKTLCDVIKHGLGVDVRKL